MKINKIKTIMIIMNNYKIKKIVKKFIMINLKS